MRIKGNDMKKSFEAIIEGKHSRRLKMEHRMLCRQELEEQKASLMIGELCRNVKVIYYVYRNRYKESASYYELVDYLKRNIYI
jgi:alpha-D-ribose 1-methylphosphonate 5-triphosphate diphosphatase PhnM